MNRLMLSTRFWGFISFVKDFHATRSTKGYSLSDVAWKRTNNPYHTEIFPCACVGDDAFHVLAVEVDEELPHLYFGLYSTTRQSSWRGRFWDALRAITGAVQSEYVIVSEENFYKLEELIANARKSEYKKTKAGVYIKEKLVQGERCATALKH